MSKEEIKGTINKITKDNKMDMKIKDFIESSLAPISKEGWSVDSIDYIARGDDFTGYNINISKHCAVANKKLKYSAYYLSSEILDMMKNNKGSDFLEDACRDANESYYGAVYGLYKEKLDSFKLFLLSELPDGVCPSHMRPVNENMFSLPLSYKVEGFDKVISFHTQLEYTKLENINQSLIDEIMDDWKESSMSLFNQ